jgi:DNA-binding response OmpR family regulator
MAPHVLVADDDAWILRMVATVLEKRGYSVETAVDGEDALARALARPPDLLITDVMMPKVDGWSLVRQLRSHAELAMMPVIFLTALSSEDDRIRGFRLGADDYVTKPFRFEELDLRVAKTLRRTAQAVQESRDQINTSGLRGDLSQVGLSSLLVLIEMERKTGLLQLRSPDGISAQILMRSGKVVHSRLDDREEPVDAECVYLLLTWAAGDFEFVTCVVEGEDRVNVSTMHLLMEGARLIDESSEKAEPPVMKLPLRRGSDEVRDELEEPAGSSIDLATDLATELSEDAGTTLNGDQNAYDLDTAAGGSDGRDAIDAIDGNPPATDDNWE